MSNSLQNIFKETGKTIEEQIAFEVNLLNQFDPDKDSKKEFETASLIDRQKHLDKI